MIRHVQFGTLFIQKGRRIALNGALLSSLDLKEGDYIQVILDTKEEVIMLKKPNSSSSDARKRKNNRRA